MNFKNFFILFLLAILIFGIANVSAIDANSTPIQDSIPNEHNGNNEAIDNNMESYEDINYDCQNEVNLNESDVLQAPSQDSLQINDDVIVVNNWDELQYYCSLSDKDYTLKLKDNTNFYPSNLNDKNQQIKINNNVVIIGSPNAYFGTNSSYAVKFNGSQVVEGYPIGYTPIIVPDNNGKSLTLENITFEYISTMYGPDGVFLQMGGNGNNIIKNCIFKNIETILGHSCIVYLKKGFATLENCSFVNCTTDFGCVSVYHPNSYTNAHMVVKDCYFENNFASTEPGCINNCAILEVYNTTFYKNSASSWAGAIHTHYYANTTIYNSNFIDNVAGWNGGALYTYSFLTIYNSSFIGNNCTTNNGGGAIGACKHVSPPYIYIDGCLFENNANNCWSLDSLSTSGTGRGGAISLMDEGSLEVRNTVFIANSASHGTAICAIEAGSYGSPDIIIVNNTFINHTRVGDVLNVRVAGTVCNVADNYYLGNSIEFSTLNLRATSVGKNKATLKVTAKLVNPSYYDSDILSKTLYDVYVNDVYVKTVSKTTFTLDFGDLDICNVYVIPTISNKKSDEITLVSTREYIFVSKNSGDDNNSGISRDVPVNTIKRALELAKDCQNIILLDGDYSENLEVDYDLTLKGEGNATLTGDMSFDVRNVNFTLKNINVRNLNSSQFIKQENSNVSISHCVIENNDALIVNGTGFTTIANSILLNNDNLINGNANYNFDYNWWGSTLENFQVKPYNNLNNWIILNVTANSNCLEIDQDAIINFAFYLIENNTISRYNDLRDIILKVTPINGSSVNETSSNSKIKYTLTALGDGGAIIEYNNVKTSVYFEFVKTNPDIKIDADDIMFGDDLIVYINLPKDLTGNLTVNVGNLAQNCSINSTNLVFTFKGLKANNYNVITSYSGDDKYLSKEIVNPINVKKYESTTELNISAINVDEDVILTVTTTDTSTGNVTLIINNATVTLTLNNSKANYTIKCIKRGDYLITAIYNGDDKYLSSQASRFIEVDNLNATVSASVDDIVYGNAALIQVTLNDDATGIVKVTIDGITNESTVSNGKAVIKISNLEAGIKNATVFYTGDNTYFNKTVTASFTINKAELTFDISSVDVMIGQDAHVHIKVPAKTTGTFTIGEDVIAIPITGSIDYVISDLELGDYQITAVYNGNNYNTVANSTSFSVLEYDFPQWANEGSDSKNTGQSPYSTNANGEIAYVIEIDGIIGNMVIDSMGNLYVATQSTIYSIDNHGILRWNYSSESLAGNFSGLSIGRDVIVSPSAGDTLYFVNQTSGEKYGSSNIYQASSLFAPIIDSSANLYLVSEYQHDTNSYKIVKVPYRSWEYGGAISLVDLGNVKPLASPSLNDDIIVVLSEGRLRVIDAKSLEVKFIKSGNYAAVKPVIGEGNIIYSILGDSIVAYTISGSQLWKTKVTGGAGNHLALDSEMGLYATNSKGMLYRYDLITGKESLISNLEITSGILVGNDGNLYFAVDDMFYGIDSQGNVLWKSYLGSKVTGIPVMDANGTIYVSSDDKVYALTNAEPKDSNLSVSIKDETIIISLNNQTTGLVSFTLNGVKYDNVLTKTILGLNDGDYQINVGYSGDARFSGSSKLLKFTVKTVLTGTNLETAYTSNSYYTVRLTQNNVPLAGKSLIFTINGKKTTVQTDNAGYASIKIILPPKTYAVTVQYANIKISKKVTVKSILQAKNLKVKKSAKSAKIKVTLKKVNGKYLKSKTLKLKINGKTLKAKTNKKGVATFKLNKSLLKKLKKGKKYTYTVTYQKDSVKKSLNVK